MLIIEDDPGIRLVVQMTLHREGLERIAGAVAAVARGDLGTRIHPRGDPSPEPIAASSNRTAEALEARVRRDARFAAAVSHELRSPLTAMMGAVDLVEHHDRLPAEGREGLALLRAEVRRFERLVADLLNTSRAARVDAGRLWRSWRWRPRRSGARSCSSSSGWSAR